MIGPVVILAAASLLSCFFAACQFALKSFNRAKLVEHLEASGRPQPLSLFVERGDDLVMVTGTLRTCCNLIVLLAALFLVEQTWPAVHPLVHYALAFAMAAALVTVFSVALPVSIARHVPEALLAQSRHALRLLLAGLMPLASLLHLFDPFVRRLSGVEPSRASREDQLSEEIRSVVEEHESEGAVDPAQKQMIEAVFDLPMTTAGEIMTPRTEVQAMAVTASLEQVKAALTRFGHSRIPVFEGTIDNVVGILYAKDLLTYLNSDQSFELRKVLREALLVPETKSVRELLAEFKARKVHIAIVLDEYGGTAGLLTIEDIIEELVGEIQDEYESAPDEPVVRRLDARIAEADGRVSIHDLNEQLALSIPEDEDYATVGGFVFSTLGHIPAVGEQFEFDGARFTVTEAARTAVKRVRVEKLEIQGVATAGTGEG